MGARWREAICTRANGSGKTGARSAQAAPSHSMEKVLKWVDLGRAIAPPQTAEIVISTMVLPKLAQLAAGRSILAAVPLLVRWLRLS